MLKKEKPIKIILLIIGILLILVSVFLLSYKYYNLYNIKKQEELKIKEFLSLQIENNDDVQDKQEVEIKQEETKKNEINYVAVIEIPKISLKKGLVDKNDRLNDVDRNIEILKESDMPTTKNGNFILASHSGNSSISYFKNLYKLNINDIVYVYYNNKTYTYKVVNKYEIEKTGKAIIKRNKNTKSLTLITCKRGTNKQFVFIAEIIREE